MSQELARLESMVGEFGDASVTREKLKRVTQLGRASMKSAKAVLRLHEALCFLRAYPDDVQILEAVEQFLNAFHARADVRKYRNQLADSGVAGTDITYGFFAEMARWLAARWPERLHVVWDEVEDAEKIESCLHLLAHYSETPFFDEWTYSMQRWCQLLAKDGEADGTFLVQRFAALNLPPMVHEWLYQHMGLVLCLRGGADTPSRTRAKRLTGPIRFQGAPLDRARPKLAQALLETDFEVREVSPSEGAHWIDLAREALVTRSRDLDAFSYGDPNDVRVVDFKDGLVFVAVGVEPKRRLLLEAVYAFLTLKNGVPIGYVLNSALFGSAEVAYNVFETYRGGESARIYGRVLAMVAKLFGADTFAVYPYQLGDENEEGLRSGAWWFYQKLGFRAKHAPTLALMRREETRMAKRPKARSSIATLKQLAKENVYYHSGAPRQDVIGVLPLSHVGAAVSRHLARTYGSDRERGSSECLDRAQSLLPAHSPETWNADERQAFERWAPLVCVLPNVEQWSPAEHAALLSIIRSKGGRREADFVHQFDLHPRLRSAIVELARTAPPSS